MMDYITETFNYNNAISSTLKDEVVKCISLCNIIFKKGNIPKIHDKLHADLMLLGWSPEVQIDSSSKISITSMKYSVGLCIQTGNMGRMYADMLKLQTMYKKGMITAGIYILPDKFSARAMGDNLAHYERLIRELSIFQDVITLPLIVFGFKDKGGKNGRN